MTEIEHSSVRAPVDTGASSPVKRDYSAVVVKARDLRREARAIGVYISVAGAIQEARLTSLPPLDLPTRVPHPSTKITLLDAGRLGGYDDGEGGSPAGNRRLPQKLTRKNR